MKRDGIVYAFASLLLVSLLVTVSCQSSNKVLRSNSPMHCSTGSLCRLTLASTNMEQSMLVDIWTPESYPLTDVTYNVLYMHDGQMLFDRAQAWNKQAWMADSTAHELISKSEVAPYIIVGIHNFEATRRADYFPQGVASHLDESARKTTLARLGNPLRADKYLRFITEELKPYIDKNYAVNSSASATAIMGSSMGGLISLYAICEYPDIFGSAACLSTHLSGWGEGGYYADSLTTFPEALCSYLEEKLPDASKGTNKIYFDYGDQTLDAYYLPHQIKVDSAMIRRGYDSRNWQTLFFAGDKHDEESWARRLSSPIKFIFAK